MRCNDWNSRWPALAALLALILMAWAMPSAHAYDAARMKEIEKLTDELKKNKDADKKLPAPKNGEVTVDIATYFDKNYHYSVYVPKKYDPKLEWPVLFCNSPGGNAKSYCEAYKDFGDEFGWIIAGSTECSNTVAGDGQFENNFVMLMDAAFRFNVHPEMCTMLGFSGGARVGSATVFQPNFPFLLGIIQMGAGHGPYPVTAQKNKQIYLLIGTKDSNYKETKEYAKECLAAGHKTVLVEWDGGHENAAPALVREALKWQTETFLKTHADKSPATLRLRKDYVEKFIKAAADSEPAGDKVATYVLYRTAVDQGNAIPIGPDVKKTLDEIQSKKMKELVKDKAVKREADCFNELKPLMAWAEKLPETKAGLQGAPPLFDALAKKYAGTPSAATATAQSKLYADKAAAAK